MSGVGTFPRVVNALRAAGVPEREALDAADAIASVKDSDIASIKADIKQLQKDVSDLRADLKAQRVEMRIIGAIVLAMFARLFFPGLFQ